MNTQISISNLKVSVEKLVLNSKEITLKAREVFPWKTRASRVVWFTFKFKVDGNGVFKELEPYPKREPRHFSLDSMGYEKVRADANAYCEQNVVSEEKVEKIKKVVVVEETEVVLKQGNLEF